MRIVSLFRLMLVMVCGLALGLTATTHAADAPASADLALELGLVGALANDTQVPSPEGASLLLDLTRTGDHWERVVGIARNYNVGIHMGRVAESNVTATGLDFVLEIKVEGDAWMPSGRASYKVSLTRAPDGALTGTYTGTFRDRPYAGRAFGRVRPPQTVVPGFVPVQPGEHPRILFRKTDLPALRQRAQTELGKLCLERMGSEKGGDGDGDAIGMGVRYQISGDKAWAEKAKLSVERHMANQAGGALAVGRAWGPRQEQVAVAYDLCYDAWTPEFRKQAETYLRWITFIVFYDQSKLSRTINWNVTSNYAGPIYSGAAFAGLALWGEKGPAPVKPAAPSAAALIPPAADFKPQAGVPVVKIELGKSPTQWLATEALPMAIVTDPMQTMNGLESERPAPGSKFTIDDKELTFASLDAKHIQAEKGGISLEQLKKDKAVTCFFYTVIDNPEPRQLKVRVPFSKAGRTQMVLNGVRVANDQVIQLEKGLYPMHCALRLSAKWGSFEPWFEAVTEADLAKSKTVMVAQQSEYEAALKEWEYEIAEWKRADGMDQATVRLFLQGRRMMYLFGREGLGRGGYQAESGSYFQHAISGPNRYHAAYLNMFGRSLSSLEDLSHYLPRVLCATVYGAAGKWQNQGINAHLELDPDNVSALFPLVPAQWQAGVLWAWNLHVGGSVEKPDLEKIASGDPIQTFLHYPTDMKPVPLNQAGLPLAWQAPDFGYYSFRNGWAGADNIVFQAFGRCRSSGGWGGDDGGTFRLMGFGQIFAHGNEGRETRRYLESVVLFPDDPDFATGKTGKLIHQAARPDGSGEVSFDLSALTLSTKDKENWPKNERYGDVSHPGTAQPGAKHIRAFGVDYSGKAGAPMLLALVDSIDGGKTKEWVWQLDDVNAAKATADGFTITKGNTTLVGHFVAPAGVKVDVGVKKYQSVISAGSGAGKAEIGFSVSRVAVTGSDPTAGQFFFVATLQQGAAPALTVTGKDLAATVKLGTRTVSFDGTKVIFGE
ncbi:MAG: hypothetical protein WCJ97_08210 [Phycisphaerae bacterium]